MGTLGDPQRCLSAPFAEAKSRDLKLQDVLPQAHFEVTKELEAAKKYIDEVEERERLANERNEALEEELKQAQQAVKDMSEVNTSRRTDLKLAENHTKFYRDLMKAEEERAGNYKQKWQDAISKQVAADEREAKIQRLEKEAVHYKSVISGLVEENRWLCEGDLKALEGKDMKMMEMEKAIRETEERYQKLEDESERFEEVYTGLVAKMENETVDCAEAINKIALKLDGANAEIRKNDQLRMATVSELQPLRRFYERCFNVLLIHQDIFQQLLSIQCQEVTYLPDLLQVNLDSAMSELEVFGVVRGAMELEGIAQDEVRDQITAMARLAHQMHESLEAIAGGVMRFVEQLDRRPDLRVLMRYKFGRLAR